MIKSAHVGHPEEFDINPYTQDGFLPLITSPNNSVVNEGNYQTFLDNKIQVCMPRGLHMKLDDEFFSSVSLSDFQKYYIDAHYGESSWKNLKNTKNPFKQESRKIKVCIDGINGNSLRLHKAIRQAKEIHGDCIVIMAGNITSVESFTNLAKTGVDYIRIGISEEITSNTGIGYTDLEQLIYDCRTLKERASPEFLTHLKNDALINYINEFKNINKVKIVADHISSYIDLCITKYNFNDNGYAAINKLLVAGADMVMIDKLFAQCFESSGQKGCSLGKDRIEICQPENVKNQYQFKNLYVKYPRANINSKLELQIVKDDIFGYRTMNKQIEGSVNWIPVRWTIDEWLNGSENQNEYPYLVGWVNSFETVIKYTNFKFYQ